MGQSKTWDEALLEKITVHMPITFFGHPYKARVILF